MLGAFIFVSAVEAPVVHLLLPWDNLRFILLGISVWGLGWMVGFLASMRVFRHLLDGTGLRIRRGTTVDLRIPWSAIRSVESRRGSVSTNRALQVEHGTGAAIAHIAVLKQTNVAIGLRRSVPVTLAEGEAQVTEVRLYVDDPRAFVATARERLSDLQRAELLSAQRPETACAGGSCRIARSSWRRCLGRGLSASGAFLFSKEVI
ncbi:MAG: hypothetical protein ACR2GT_01165 [Gaiellaceae bacterium]